jgi:hypothetical protein
LGTQYNFIQLHSSEWIKYRLEKVASMTLGWSDGTLVGLGVVQRIQAGGNGIVGCHVAGGTATTTRGGAGSIAKLVPTTTPPTTTRRITANTKKPIFFIILLLIFSSKIHHYL